MTFHEEENICEISGSRLKSTPIIISTCCKCNIELFRSSDYQPKALHRNFCMLCYEELEDKAWRYDNLDK